MADKKKHKIRAEFRKNRSGRARSDDWTRRFHADGGEASDESIADERISGKGDVDPQADRGRHLAADAEDRVRRRARRRSCNGQAWPRAGRARADEHGGGRRWLDLSVPPGGC